jgi:hypothetical protein
MQMDRLATETARSNSALEARTSKQSLPAGGIMIPFVVSRKASQLRPLRVRAGFSEWVQPGRQQRGCLHQ